MSKTEIKLNDELLKENEILKRGIIAVRNLINDSEGVTGLHLNGDIALFDELERGGRFEDWLYDFNVAEDCIKKLTKE